MSRTSPFLQLVSLLYSLKDRIELQDLVLEPHLDVDERIGQSLGQVVEIDFEFLIFGILEEELLLR